MPVFNAAQWNAILDLPDHPVSRITSTPAADDVPGITRLELNNRDGDRLLRVTMRDLQRIVAAAGDAANAAIVVEVTERDSYDGYDTYSGVETTVSISIEVVHA